MAVRMPHWFRQIWNTKGLSRWIFLVGLFITLVFVVFAIFAPWIAPYHFNQTAVDGVKFPKLGSASSDHWLGTNDQFYDIASRMIWGARTGLEVVVMSVAFAGVIGVPLGLLSGFVGGWIDRVLVFLMDAIYAFPSLLLAIVVAIVISGGQSSMWGGIMAAAISITVIYVPQYFRVVRAEVVRIKAEAFVESAKVIGAGHWRIMTRHVLRNATRTLPLIVTLNASEAVSTLAALGFLGFGIQPTAAAEWGYDLGKSLSDVTSGIWWTSLFPGLAIVLVVLGLTLVGESLNDLADPRLRTRRRAADVPPDPADVSVVPGGTLGAGPGGLSGLEGSGEGDWVR
jgi:peptide/nickel transport system permease protein